MARVATHMTVLAILLAALVLPTAASAGGCEVLTGARDRAECAAREQARAAARAEVQRQVGGATAAATPVGNDGHSAAWTRALAEADGFDASQVFEPRPIAAVVGLAWIGLVMRSRWRARRRRARG